jgi:5-methylcytosine-specific restriction enzyme subunit McrC
VSVAAPRVLELAEFKPLALAPEELSAELAATIRLRYSNQIAIEQPWPGVESRWRLTALGWVGFIPLSPTLVLALRPKVPLQNLFGMLEYAYQTELKKLDDDKALIECADLREFYTRLAHVLARRVLDRERKGLHRAYVGRYERLPVVAGRPDIQRSLSRPWDVQLECHFEEHTPDVEDNQLLAWTLRRIAQSGLCTGQSGAAVRHAWRGLQGGVTLRPFSADDCLGRIYHRLNRDYEVLHALCRFFLENSGPAHSSGGHTFFPFLVDMAQLFERFVAGWLQKHLPPDYMLRPQCHVQLSDQERLQFIIDLVLWDRRMQKTVCVLDTKYKKEEDGTASDDVGQVMAYADTQLCHKAVLIYPSGQLKPLTKVGHDVRRCVFDLSGDLENAGQAFLRDLLQFVVGE